jgi:two-component system, chemotaxis family, protein-glutamate methylesterase/glutaminase
VPASSRLTRPTTRHEVPIRVLIVDDSAVARAALSRLVSEAPEFEVVAALDGARRAIERLAEVDVDIVLLDIQMPGLDGLSALPSLIEASGGARILIVSTLAVEGARATIEALALGAADTLGKPEMGSFGRQFGAVLIEKMLRLGKAMVTSSANARPVQILRPVPETPIACVAIGSSTGGLHALASFFSELPREFAAPILITQHLPPSFMAFFADQMATLSGRKSRVAEEGMVLNPSEVIVAPGDRHMGLRRIGKSVQIALRDEVTASHCCPSVDPMFSGVAEVFGNAAIAIILSGMGRDGESGASAIARGGGTVIVQDRQSSAVWGMPGCVASAGIASLVANPVALAAYVAQRGSA